MSYLDIRNVIKSYDKENNIIKELSLSINKGEFLVKPRFSTFLTCVMIVLLIFKINTQVCEHISD